MITNIDNVLLIKYMRKELNESESQRVVDWLQEKEENKHFLFGLKEAYMLSRWDELSDKAEPEDGWNELKKSLRKNQPSLQKKYLRVGLRCAAVIIILIATGFFMNNQFKKQPPQYTMIETATGQQSTLTLNDGTIVRLNQNSKLIYPKNFDQHTRHVTLQGEAYFEVAHNVKKPFLVDVGCYTVKVLGTKFNVAAYSGNVYSYTSLKEGKVLIIDNQEGHKVLSELKPGTQLGYNKKTGDYSVKSIDINAIATWSLNQIVIRDQKLETVAEMLSSKYGYTFDITNSKIEKLKYNITIEKEPLDEILSDIHCVTPQVHYSIDHEKKLVIFK